MRYDTSELQIPGFPAFPGDGTTDVCASGAISWPLDTDSGPVIDGAKCFGCGLCVVRCPVGAIHLTKETTAVVVDIDTKQVRADTATSGLITHASFLAAKKVGVFSQERDSSVERTADHLATLLGRSGPRFPNLLARNLMIGTGWRALIRRSGDTNIRIDLVAQMDLALCAVEVEFSDAVIDAPRSVLDSLSVLLVRYNLKRKTLFGMVFASALPNQRSEYWHVIADIEKALHVRIHTVTPGALMMLVWAGKTLNYLPFGTLGHASIRREIEQSIGRKVNVNFGVAAVLETAK